MSSRDFVALANILAGARHAARLGAKAGELVDIMAEAIADYCQTRNSRFDRERFLEASRKAGSGV